MLVIGAKAQQNNAATQTIKITTGKVVISIQIPKQVDNHKPLFVFSANSVVNRKDAITLIGHSTLRLGTNLTIKADHIVLNQNASRISSMVLQGNASVEVQEAGKKSMQFSADNATVEFEKSN